MRTVIAGTPGHIGKCSAKKAIRQAICVFSPGEVMGSVMGKGGTDQSVSFGDFLIGPFGEVIALKTVTRGETERIEMGT